MHLATRVADTFLNVTIRFLGPENMGIGTGIMLLGQLDTKLCYKFANLATLFYGSGNPGTRTLLTISHSIPYPRKHGYRHRNHVHMLIRRSYAWNTLIWQPCFMDLATLLPVHFWQCHHSIPYPQKHGYRHQNHVPMWIRCKVMLKTPFLVPKRLFWKIKKIEQIFFSKKQKTRFQKTMRGVCVQNFRSIASLVWSGRLSDTYIPLTEYRNHTHFLVGRVGGGSWVGGDWKCFLPLGVVKGKIHFENGFRLFAKCILGGLYLFPKV